MGKRIQGYEVVCLVACLLQSCSGNSSPLVPTNWGTAECSEIPYFQLEDYQSSSGDKYMQSYGLSDLNTDADITIVGLYFADSSYCQERAAMQDQLGKALTKKKIKVNNIAINYYAPMYCVVQGDCVSDWWSSLGSLLPWKDNCEGYISGCAPDDSHLNQENWQDKLSEYTDMPIFQDTNNGWVWDEFGGREGDIFIYDKQKKLYAYMCDVDNPAEYRCTNQMIGGLLNTTNYETAYYYGKKAAKEDLERCNGEESDDEGGEEGDDDYYYSYEEENYYDYDEDNDDDNEERVYYVDDSYYSNDYDGYTDDGMLRSSVSIGVNRRHHKHRVIHKVPTYIYASLIAIVATAVTFCILYCRWRYLKTRNSIEREGATFIRLATEDDDGVILASPAGATAPSTASVHRVEGAEGSQWHKNDVGYGSL